MLRQHLDLLICAYAVKSPFYASFVPCPLCPLRVPPVGVQILSISCSFWENSTNLYVGAPLGSWRPLLGEILDPPLPYVPHIAYSHQMSTSVSVLMPIMDIMDS